MPELPEVETVVRDIRPRIVGKFVHRVRTSRSNMQVSSVGNFSRSLTGQVLASMRRQGKWMFVELSDSNTLVLHLGMTGRLTVESAEKKIVPHTHLRIGLDDGTEELRFVDPRRFGEVLLFDPASFAERFGPHALGEDALTMRRTALAEKLRRTKRRIKAALMDQRVVAGVGNIYADEILHAAGVSPSTIAEVLSADDIARIHRQMGLILRRSIKLQGTTIRDYVSGHGVPGGFQSRLSVYGRAESPCKTCATPIQLDRTILTGRATYWCPRCQK